VHENARGNFVNGEGGGVSGDGCGDGCKSRYNSADQSVEGDITLYDTPSGNLARSIVEELLSSPGESPDIGLSIVFYPIWEFDPESEERTVTHFKHVESVDLVFQPAADGRILQALSAFNSKSTKRRICMPEPI
jgi:hypothetical protein